MAQEFRFENINQARSFYTNLVSEGFQGVAGVDEVGRGAYAGPVAVACVLLPANHGIEGIKDSKKLSIKRRTILAAEITSKCFWALGFRYNEDIDRLNIREATFQAAVDAVLRCSESGAPIDYVLCDGGLNIDERIPFASNSVVKGDLWFESISAASIVAKTHRDLMMADYHKKWPEYGFNTNQGYGTKFHKEAIGKHGISPIHRKTFGICRTAKVRS